MRIDRVKFATVLARADISSQELAHRAELSRVTISNVKSGRSCSKTTAAKIAAGLGIDVSELVADEYSKGVQ